MKYSDFLRKLARNININIKTLHNSFIESHIDINKYLNIATARITKQEFENDLMNNAIDKFGIEYQKVANEIDPTKLTNEKGEPLSHISAADIAVLYFKNELADSYLLDELFYDSDLEEENIKTETTEVVVLSKIPKNSIKIPIFGRKSYAPDSAYVLDYKDQSKNYALLWKQE